eukprot:2285291-Rhodomonas_salina.1
MPVQVLIASDLRPYNTPRPRRNSLQPCPAATVPAFTAMFSVRALSMLLVVLFVAVVDASRPYPLSSPSQLRNAGDFLCVSFCCACNAEFQPGKAPKRFLEKT